MIVGAHLRNEARLPQEDIDKFSEGRFDGALLFHYTGTLAHEALGVDPRNCIVRLPDSVYTHPNGAKYVPSYWDYAHDLAVIVKEYADEGYELFQLDNEPNLTWPALGFTDWDYAWFMEHAIPCLKDMLRGEGLSVKLGSPPVANACIEGADWFKCLRVVRSMCDWVAVHAYWQGEGWTWEQFGRSYRSLQSEMALAGEDKKPLYLTECGCSNCFRKIPPTPEQLQATFAAQYPRYIEQCREDGVDGLFFFILASNGDWKGFEMGNTVTTAIGQYLHPAGGGGRNHVD